MFFPRSSEVGAKETDGCREQERNREEKLLGKKTECEKQKKWTKKIDKDVHSWED